MKKYQFIFTAILGLLMQPIFAQLKPKPLTEEDFYEIKTIAIPNGIQLEIGGVAPMPDGRLRSEERRVGKECSS